MAAPVSVRSVCVCGGALGGVEMEMRECYPWALLAVLVLDIKPISGGVVAVYFLLFTNCEVICGREPSSA